MPPSDASRIADAGEPPPSEPDLNLAARLFESSIAALRQAGRQGAGGLAGKDGPAFPGGRPLEPEILVFEPILAEPGKVAIDKSGKVQPAELADFTGLVRANFARLDGNNDGKLSADEVDRAMEDSSFTGRDAQMVAALKGEFAGLACLKNQGAGDRLVRLAGPFLSNLIQKDEITLAEIDEFEQMQQAVEREKSANARLLALAGERFASLDGDADGFLTAGEIERVLAAKGIPADERLALEHMRQKAGEMQEASDDEFGFENDGVSEDDIEQYVRDRQASDSFRLVRGVAAAMVSRIDGVRQAERRLYADESKPVRSIKPEAVQQGGIGNCYFMAALASLAETNPQAIADMIADNGDGTFTVKFAGAPDQPVTVSAPTDQELQLFQGGSKHGLWAAVMEKAYGQWCNERKFFFQKRGGTASEGADGGGQLQSGLWILTGRDVDNDVLMLTSKKALGEKIGAALREGRPATCGTGRKLESILGLSEPTTEDGLAEQHAYSIVGYDEKEGIVTLRNPWGHGEPTHPDGTTFDGADDGVFRMTLRQFKRNFLLVSFG